MTVSYQKVSHFVFVSRYCYNFWSLLFENKICLIEFITYHRCDVTHGNASRAAACNALTDTGFHTTWHIAYLRTHRTVPLRLFCLEYHARKSVPYKLRISTSWNISWFSCGQGWTTCIARCSYRTVATPSQCMCKSSRGIFWIYFLLSFHATGLTVE